MPREFKRQIILSPQAVSDLKFWKKNKPSVIERISRLLTSMEIDPYKGIGKPKALHYDFEGLWSRRIDKDHRIIYEVINERIEIHSLRGHYGDK
jgi:toxin YoeB